MCARSATRSTPASRRSWTSAAGSSGSSAGTASGRSPAPSSSADGARPWVPGVGRRFRATRRADLDVVAADTPRDVATTSGSAQEETRMTSTPDRLPALLAEHADLEAQLADPAVHADQSRARRLGRRYAELTPVVATVRELDAARADLATARELSGEDASFAAEAEVLAGRVDQLGQRLRELLLPRDPNDGKDVILQVKAGEGGEESALFAGDLLRMYLRYAERQGWKAEVLDAEQSDLGGDRDVTVAVKAAGRGRLAGTADGAWSLLKYEGGVHRVQRVPVTESQGRIHTSAAGVLVMPEA